MLDIPGGDSLAGNRRYTSPRTSTSVRLSLRKGTRFENSPFFVNDSQVLVSEAAEAADQKETAQMTDQTTQQQINQAAWAACDTFRGIVDAGQYKDYILVMLFLKYISDLWKDHLETYQKQYKGDKARIQRRMKRERFVLSEGGGGRGGASTISTLAEMRPISAS